MSYEAILPHLADVGKPSRELISREIYICTSGCRLGSVFIIREDHVRDESQDLFVRQESSEKEVERRVVWILDTLQVSGSWPSRRRATP